MYDRHIAELCRPISISLPLIVLVSFFISTPPFTKNNIKISPCSSKLQLAKVGTFIEKQCIRLINSVRTISAHLLTYGEQPSGVVIPRSYWSDATVLDDYAMTTTTTYKVKVV